MTNPLESNVIAAQQALAAADLTTINACLAVFNDPAQTLGAAAAALTTLGSALGDPGRVAELNSIAANWNAAPTNLQAMAAAAQAASSQ